VVDIGTKLDCISVRLYGGLGNQLFQFFAGYSLALTKNVNLNLDCSWLSAESSHQNSNLSDFRFISDLDIDIVNNKKKSKKVSQKFNWVIREFHLSPRITKLHVPKETGYVNLVNLPKGVELRGYYQSYLYLDTVMESKHFWDWSLKNEFQSRNSGNSIAIHFRGGDYLLPGSSYVCLNENYYLNAIERVRSIFPDSPILVFSDDKSHAEDIISRLGNIEFSFFPDQGMTAAQVLSEMSNCRAIIGSNSTFSYWAGMLARKESLKIFPSLWFLDGSIPKELYPPDWSII
jgi:hypothetical protein